MSGTKPGKLASVAGPSFPKNQIDRQAKTSFFANRWGLCRVSAAAGGSERNPIAPHPAESSAAASAAKEAADKLEPLDVGWERRLAAARAAIAPSEPVAYRFVPRQGGFVITAITAEDLAVPVSPKTPLKWPKV
jgi:hypothetical protein